MPYTVGQYLSANDLKSQEDAHTLGYGVVSGLKVVPTDPASMDVQVETGKAYVADTLVEKGAVTNLTVGAADPTNPRKDIVVCNSAGTLSIVAGTPEAALPSGNVGVYTLKPEPPSIPANSIILVEIWVPAGAAEITGSEIYDKRVFIADFIGHKADASAHHAKTADNEVYGLLLTGTDAGKPAAGVANRWYFATDTLILYRDNGTSWVEAARGETAIRLAQLVEKAHASLTGVTADQHHPQAHTLASHSTKAHSELTGIGASDHHAKYTNAEAVSAVEAAGLALASGKNIKLIQALTSDHSWSGITAIMTAGENLVIGDAVYAKSDGKMWKADADTAATMPIIALATGTISAGTTGEFLLLGFIRDDTWNWTIGGLLYGSVTPGSPTQTAPSGTGDQVQVIGVAITADIIFFNPSLELVEIS